MTEQEWKQFLSETFADELRPAVHNLIRDFARIQEDVIEFAEIGFGQCWDFAHCFQGMVEEGRMFYTGYDVTLQFVEHAQRAFPGYQFICGNPLAELTKQFDVVYCRHVIEHQEPEHSYDGFRNLLKMAGELAVVVWFCPPRSVETFKWVATDGMGAWVNTLDKDRLAGIIAEQGFSLEVRSNSVYIMRRVKT